MPGKPIERDECVIHYAQEEIYKFYKNKIKDLGPESVYNVGQGLVGKIQGEFNRTWMQELLVGKGLTFKTPYKIGNIFCIKKKTKLRFDEEGNIITRLLPVDWYRSKQKWAKMWPGLSPAELKKIPKKPLVFCLNEHSNGYRYSFFWDRRGQRFTNIRAYNFVPNRKNHRHLAKVAKDPDLRVDYWEMPPKRRYRSKTKGATPLK